MPSIVRARRLAIRATTLSFLLAASALWSAADAQTSTPPPQETTKSEPFHTPFKDKKESQSGEEQAFQKLVSLYDQMKAKEDARDQAKACGTSDEQRAASEAADTAEKAYADAKSAYVRDYSPTIYPQKNPGSFSREVSSKYNVDLYFVDQKVQKTSKYVHAPGTSCPPKPKAAPVPDKPNPPAEPPPKPSRPSETPKPSSGASYQPDGGPRGPLVAHPGDDALAASAAGAPCADAAVAKRIAWLNEDDEQARDAIDALYVRVGKIENENQSIRLKYEHIGMGDDYINHIPRVSELDKQDAALSKDIATLEKRRAADQAEVDALNAKPPCVDPKAVPVRAEPRTPLLPAPPPNPPPAAAPSKPVSAICQHCAWLKTQVQDIDDEIAGLQRQDASIRKYSNLSDPNIQNALKDIANKIANLRKKQARLRAEMRECEKKCLPPAEAQIPPTQPSPSEPVPAGEPSPPKPQVTPSPPAPAPPPCNDGTVDRMITDTEDRLLEDLAAVEQAKGAVARDEHDLRVAETEFGPDSKPADAADEALRGARDALKDANQRVKTTQEYIESLRAIMACPRERARTPELPKVPEPPVAPTPAKPVALPPCDDGSLNDRIAAATYEVLADKDLVRIVDEDLREDKNKLDEARKSFGEGSDQYRILMERFEMDAATRRKYRNRQEEDQRILDALKGLKTCPTEGHGATPKNNGAAGILRNILGGASIGVELGGGRHRERRDDTRDRGGDHSGKTDAAPSGKRPTETPDAPGSKDSPPAKDIRND